MREEEDAYAVGYKLPPKHSQFQKGQSGNPYGRPRGSKSRKTMLEKILAETATYREGDMQFEATKLELLLRAIRLKAAMGEATAMRLYDRLMGLGDHDLVEPLPGLLIIPRRLTVEEWERKYSPGESSEFEEHSE